MRPGVSPALAGEVSRQVADSDSVRAGLAALERRGITLSQGKTLRMVNHFSHRALEQRSHWMAIVRAGGALLRGKHMVVATESASRQRVDVVAPTVIDATMPPGVSRRSLSSTSSMTGMDCTRISTRVRLYTGGL